MRKIPILLALFVTGCSLINPAPTPPPPQQVAIATEAALPTDMATFTPTITNTPTATFTPTATGTPTATPSLTPTPNPYALQAALGGTRRIPRSQILNLRAPQGLQISPLLFGLNYWTFPFGPNVDAALAPLNITVLRRGGTNVEQEAVNWQELDEFILDCRTLNIEPLVQVPIVHHDPAFAARMVRYMNIQKGYDVRFWSIGNEPDKNGRAGAQETWLRTWRSFRDAMKAVDPRIKILGPDLAFAYDFNNPANDWLTPFLQKNGDAVDAISLHRYGYSRNQSNPTVLVGSAFTTARWVQAMRAHIRAVTGRDIPLAITEMNLSSDWTARGENSGQSFSAGLWMAETLGEMAESGVAMANVWNAKSYDSLGIITQHAESKRPTYYAMLLYSNYGDQLVPLASHVQNVSAHAGRDSRTGNVTIVLVNRGRSAYNFQLVFNSGEEQKSGAIYFDLNDVSRMDLTMPAQSMAGLVFDGNMNLTRSIVYTRDMFNQGQDPEVSQTTP
jgi:hypothetical protein